MNTKALPKTNENLRVNSKLSILFLYVLLFMYAFNFMGIGEFFPILMLPFLVNYSGKMKVKPNFAIAIILLTSFSFFYVIFIYSYNYVSLIGAIGRLLYPLLFFILGYSLVDKNIDYKQILKYFYVITIGLTLYGVFSLFKSIYLYGSMEEMMRIFGGRNVINLWGSGFISATALTAYLSLSLSTLPILFIKGLGKFSKSILSIMFMVSVYTVFQTSSRTGILIILGSLITTTLFTEKLGVKKLKKIFFSIVILFTIYFLYSVDFLGIKTYLDSTYLYHRLTTTDTGDSRSDAWKTVISNIFNYPLGGKKIDLKLNYAHNLWLDVAYEGGVLPFFLLLSFSFTAVLSVIKLLKNKHPIYFKVSIISSLTAFVTIFMLEPVLQGLTVYFMFFCFFIGVVFKINYVTKKE